MNFGCTESEDIERTVVTESKPNIPFRNVIQLAP